MRSMACFSAAEAKVFLFATCAALIVKFDARVPIRRKREVMFAFDNARGGWSCFWDRDSGGGSWSIMDWPTAAREVPILSFAARDTEVRFEGSGDPRDFRVIDWFGESQGRDR